MKEFIKDQVETFKELKNVVVESGILPTKKQFLGTVLTLALIIALFTLFPVVVAVCSWIVKVAILGVFALLSSIGIATVYRVFQSQHGRY